MQKSKTLWIDSQKHRTNSYNAAKLIKEFYHNTLQRIRDVKAQVEDVTNYSMWKDKFFLQLVDWLWTCFLLVTVVLLVTSKSKILLAIGIFIGIEVTLVYLGQIRKVFE